MNQSTHTFGTGIFEDDYNYRSELNIPEAIHTHFHLGSANQSDCNNITNLIKDYLLVLARNISAHNMLDTNHTKAISIESELIFIIFCFSTFFSGCVLTHFLSIKSNKMSKVTMTHHETNSETSNYLNILSPKTQF